MFTLRITAQTQAEYNGGIGDLVTVETYPLSIDVGKRKIFIPLRPQRGVLFKYEVFGGVVTEAAWIYREETHVWVRPWGTNRLVKFSPFGNDDLDLVRAMNSPEGVAARGGGGR